jgi:hypothetical protein
MHLIEKGEEENLINSNYKNRKKTMIWESALALKCRFSERFGDILLNENYELIDFATDYESIRNEERIRELST